MATLPDGRREGGQVDRKLEIDGLGKGSGRRGGGYEGDEEDGEDAIVEQCGRRHAVVHLCNCTHSSAHHSHGASHDPNRLTTLDLPLSSTSRTPSISSSTLHFNTEFTS